MRVKCLAQEHNTMSPARARTRTARSGDERTNHEATATKSVGHKLHIEIFLLPDLLQNPQVDHLCLDKTWETELW